MKKFLTLVLMFVMAFSLVSCNKDDDDNGGNNNQQQQQPATEDVLVADTFAGLTTGKKVYLTTIGQSDIDTVQNIMQNADAEKVGFYTEDEEPTTKDVNVYVDNLLAADEVADGSVVFLVTGASTKGLGAAGTKITEENARADAFATAAKANKFTLVVLHVGGEQRRGTQADPIINKVVPAAKLVMVVNTGNADGLFTNLCSANSVSFNSYTRSSKMVASFKKIFGLA